MFTTGSTRTGFCITMSLHPVTPDWLWCHIPLPWGQALGDPPLHQAMGTGLGAPGV